MVRCIVLLEEIHSDLGQALAACTERFMDNELIKSQKGQVLDTQSESR